MWSTKVKHTLPLSSMWLHSNVMFQCTRSSHPSIILLAGRLLLLFDHCLHTATLPHCCLIIVYTLPHCHTAVWSLFIVYTLHCRRRPWDFPKLIPGVCVSSGNRLASVCHQGQSPNFLWLKKTPVNIIFSRSEYFLCVNISQRWIFFSLCLSPGPVA